MSADFIAIDLDRPQFAGALHDPVAAIVLCLAHSVDYSFINGRKVISEGRLTTVDQPHLIDQTNRLAKQLVG